MTAPEKKTRKAFVDGTGHTDATLEAMKTGEIAALVASIRGGNPLSTDIGGRRTF